MFERLKDFSRHALARITGQSEANDADRRRSERNETLIFGTVMSGGQMVPVRVLDLSRGGARIELPEAQNIRDLVWLHWPRLERLGRVMWAEGRSIGVKFAQPLGPQELQSILAA